MRYTNKEIFLAATDLANHLACKHLTTLDRAGAVGELNIPERYDPILEILRERGLRHEEDTLSSLQPRNLLITRINTEGESAEKETLEAMQRGDDVIVQAELALGRWRGRADILLKIDTASTLGPWSYEAMDTKLSVETKGGTLLQLCLYSQLLEQIQDLLPKKMHVVTPRGSEAYLTQEFIAYFRLTQRNLVTFVEAGAEVLPTYPEPVLHCDICRWWEVCDTKRRHDDHLSLVANVTRLQRREFDAHGITTLKALAQSPLPFPWKPERGNITSYEKAREQARLQFDERTKGKPVFELQPVAPDIGLARLPELSPGDVFFDIEGDTFIGKNGFEYLFGYVTLEKDAPRYHRIWAMDSYAERKMFECFMDMLTERYKNHPDFHVYHYAPYEPSALKRLMGRYATRDDELDNLLRAERFIDLYGIVRQSVLASVERYSIKDLEKFYGFNRSVDLREASKALHSIEWSLELGRFELINDDSRKQVEEYNKDDCFSTYHLRNWLEKLRSQQIQNGITIPRPAHTDIVISEKLSDKLREIRELQNTLLESISDDIEKHTETEHAVWILAHLLEYYRREDKAVWWEYFRLCDLPEEDLLYEKAGLYGLDFLKEMGGTAKCPIHRYGFIKQESDLRSGIALHCSEGPIGTIESIDHAAGIIDIKKRTGQADYHPVAVFGHERVSADVLEGSLMRLAQWVCDHGIDAEGPYRAARNLLLRRPPNINNKKPKKLRREQETVQDAAIRIVLGMKSSILAIQGPPGTGKTYTGARMICALVAAGYKVGITAVSHKVIGNQLEKAIEAAKESGLSLKAIQKVSSIAEDPNPAINETTDNDDISTALNSDEFLLAAGTAWLWARDDLFESVDVLFVDEAGQMTLAQVLAVAQSCNNLVLLGDPRQLEQPQQSCHPPGSDVSSLEYVFGNNITIPEDQGLFLDQTYRLHPSICSFTSEIFYENRLESRPELVNQCITGGDPFDGNGLWYVPVEHQGNQNTSIEEAEMVVKIVNHLLSGQWADQNQKRHKITLNDILIVAPYNAQVANISERIPGGRVGTVDKFQGQEAPVVIYSMTTSTPEDAPRGMEFLYSLNRLNVATSRARAACILIANRAILEPECRTPAQMKLANALCRYIELASKTYIN